MVLWWQVLVTIVCLLLSGTFSGLTLGLMSLDLIDLRVLTESGSPREKRYAARILPVRKHGNWLLCTLLIGNTAVNSALAIVTADLFGGIAGFMASSVAILYLGEIIPQAVCHRFGLVIGAVATPFIRFFMLLTGVLSYPTAKLLDFALGGEPRTRYNKTQLKSLLSLHGTAPAANADASASLDAAEKGSADVFSAIDTSSMQGPQSPNRNSSVFGQAGSDATDGNHIDLTSPTGQQQGPTTVTSTNSADVDSAAATPSSLVHAESPALPSPSQREAGEKTRSWFAFKRNRNLEKVARKEREKREKEKDQPPENPPLTRDEMAMLGGAFDFSQKLVRSVMTSLDQVFMLESSLSLNFEVLLLIFQSGHSRIPVYSQQRENIIGVLFAKDLILLDPEDSVPIRTVLHFFTRSLLVVYADRPLDEMLNIFKQGGGHLAIVQKVDPSISSDPTPETIGVVTLEDLIEALIGQDIVDETDVYTDNRSKKKVVKRVRAIDPEILKMFDSKHAEDRLTEKEVLVVAAYLRANTREFSSGIVQEKILHDMLTDARIEDYKHEGNERSGGGSVGGPGTLSVMGQEEFSAGGSSSHGPLANADVDGTRSHSGSGSSCMHVDHPISNKATASNDDEDVRHESATIYKRSVPTKNAYLILNGRLEICAGSDGFKSDAGPWTLLGISALTDDLYAPDFTARVVERPARLLRLTRKMYRLMVQYSGKNLMAAVGEDGQVKKAQVSPMTFEPSSVSRKGISSDARMDPAKSSSSLAVAAAAAAVAVGSPRGTPGRSSQEFPDLSPSPVTRFSRSRQNGRSLEWSEIEPAGKSSSQMTGALGENGRALAALVTNAHETPSVAGLPSASADEEDSLDK